MTLSPRNENELADVVRAAIADERTLEIVGRGTKKGLGRPVEAAARLDLSALTGIVRYEPDELVITARAGTPIADIEAAAAERNQRIGFDPADWSALYGTQAHAATIGGTLSANACGAARLRYGAARDHLLGFRAVNGAGEIYKAGGRVVKNVTGFDMPKLVCGAMGTLGPLSEVTLRLVPRAAASLTLAARDVNADEGLALLNRAWQSPLEASGLAYLPPLAAQTLIGGAGEGVCLFRLDGTAPALAEKLSTLKSLPGAQDVSEVDDGAFAHIGVGQAFVARESNVWRVFVPPASAAACARALDAKLWLADWAGGVLWTETDADVHAIAARFDGTAILMRGDAARRQTPFAPETPVRAALTRRVKAAFDPRGLFNPGRMHEGL